ncbi:alginate lyase-domain-containing protein [Ephemerocybe angulata]|nr:alginate lyase-domain-containing protein [Tulosesus angulatus]
MVYTSLVFATLLSVSLRVAGQTAYANDFVDPDYIVAGNFPTNTGGAQATINGWAKTLAAKGPWSVMDKQGIPPTNDKHDYLSWAPYWWPDCTNAGNTTVLTEQEIWTTCTYVRRDGQFNPDVRTVNDVGNFQDMSEAVFYNALAWAFTKTPSNTNSKDAVRFLNTWFLAADTRMNPNLDYSQMQRGPGRQIGSQTGVLDLKGMAKISSAILILRKGGNTDWTSDLDSAMVSWSQEYIKWLETSELALGEGSSDNNHGSFYYNQLAALKLIVNDKEGATQVTRKYFSRQYQSQINANGEQPLEAARTRPYHYRAYNLAAMITSARIEKYADPSSDVWNRTASSGAGIKAALDYAMTFSAADSDEASYAVELHPNVASVAAIYGDPDSKYATYLKKANPSFASEPYFFWNQPFAPNEGSALPSSTRAANAAATTSGSTKTSKSQSKDNDNGALSQTVGIWSMLTAIFAGYFLL